MKIVIDIPEEEYNYVKTQVAFGNTNPLKMRVANGAQLSKGHGRLIDADELLKHKRIIGTSNYCEYAVVYTKNIQEAPTIIEADRTKGK